MRNIPSISEAELEIMKLLWANSPMSSNEIVFALSDKMNWSSQTIKTFLNRLMNKNAIGFEKKARNYMYYPLISQDEYLKVENKSFLQKFYNGTVSMLFAKFLEEEPLSEEDIDRLYKILERKKKGN